MSKEDFKKIEGYDATLEPCPFCGSPAELWEITHTKETANKFGACTNAGDEINDDEGCPMYMPNDGFYKATKVEAVNEWNKRMPNLKG